MGRFDTFKIDNVLLPISDAQELEDLNELVFQTKDLDKEFLDYFVDEKGNLMYEDFEYQMTPSENPNGLFSMTLTKTKQINKKSYHTGEVVFYGKPYETFYTFKATFHDGMLQKVDLLSKE